MNDTLALVLIIILGMILSFLIPFLIKFTKQNKEQDKIIKTLEEKVNKPQDAHLARLNNEITFKENRTAELEVSIATLKNEIEIIQKSINEKRDAAQKIDMDVKDKQNALIDAMVRARVERDAVVGETQALVGEKMRLQKEIEDEKRRLAIGGENAAAIERQLANLIELEKEMRLRSAQEMMGHGVALEFDNIELVEIKELREVLVRLRNAAPLEKAIYEIYYRDKMKRMVGTLGLDGVSGIYRIWTVDGGIERNYIGQSVDVGNRWVQHLKRMVGAEEPTGIVLYAAAKKIGVENLKWECVEKCDKSVLSEREKYWGNFYAVKETGFNTKLG